MGLVFLLIFFMSIPVFMGLIFLSKKRAWFQSIYALAPGSHQNKQATASFGGVAMVIALLLTWVFFRYTNPVFIWVVLVFCGFASIGFLDDFLSLWRGKNKGLLAWQKFLLQLVFAFLSVGAYAYFFEFLSWSLLFFYVFLMVGSSNATNLTDGLDGLLGGLSLITLFGFLWFFLLHHHEVGIEICFVFFPILMAFMLFNVYPAKLFMGDTGALALGALFVCLSIIASSPFILLSLGAVYVIETLSVMIQVLYYKWCQKRFFLMAPLHHHFELMGLSEQRVVFVFWGVGLLFVLFYIFSL